MTSFNLQKKKTIAALDRLGKVRRFALLAMLTLSIATMSAQHEAKHAIEVARLSNWAPDYLTVTNTWNNMTFYPETSSLKCMTVVTAINGEDTQALDEEEFYRILDSSEQFTLKYITKTLGVNREYEKTFTKRKGKLLITPIDDVLKLETVSLLSDNDVDFFNFNTYDYQLYGDDQLMDKTILEVFAEWLKTKGLKKVTKDPDIYLYLTKDVNQKIESVYVPTYTTTTELGSSSVGVSNIFGLKGVNVRGSKTGAVTVTKETGGTMRTSVNADAYLEVSILQANKLNSETAPVVWQLTYSEHMTKEVRLLDYVKSHLGGYMLQYPFHNMAFGFRAATWGVFCQNFASSPLISDIVPGSKAEQLGCSVGDEIKYVRYSDSYEDFCVYRPGNNFYADRIITTTNMMQVGKKKITKGGLTEMINYVFIK